MGISWERCRQGKTCEYVTSFWILRMVGYICYRDSEDTEKRGDDGKDLNVIQIRENKSLGHVEATSDDIFGILIGESGREISKKEGKGKKQCSSHEEDGSQRVKHAVLVSSISEDQSKPLCNSINHHRPLSHSSLNRERERMLPMTLFKFQICFKEKFLIIC